MRNVLAALLLLFASASAALAQSSFNASTQFSVPIVGGVTAGLRLVTGIAGKRIYVTNYTLAPAALASGAVAFIQGTGSNCGTNTVSLTGAMSTVTGAPIVPGDGSAPILVLSPGQDLCIIITATPAPGSLAYALF